MEYVTNAPHTQPGYQGTYPQRRSSLLPGVLSSASAVLAAAALAVSLMHGGPQGLRGLTGAPGATGAQGQAGPQGPAATDPYSYICTITNMPGFPGGGLQTGYYPCSPVNPNGG